MGETKLEVSSNSENKEAEIKIDQNMNENSKRKALRRKKRSIIILGIFITILVGIVVYNLMISRIEEDVYFISYTTANEERFSILYCYDASENKLAQLAKMEGRIFSGTVDPEKGRLLFWYYNPEKEDTELIVYYPESNQMEAYINETAIEKITGLALYEVIFDRTDKNCIYLSLFDGVYGDECQWFIAKYVFETGEITDLQETGRRYTHVCNGSFYVDEDNLDITTDGKSVLIMEKGEDEINYFINDRNTESNIMVARISEPLDTLISYQRMHFITGESNNCVYVRSVMTIFDQWADGSVWIKEPGHIAKKIYSFFSYAGDVTILY